MTYAVMNSVFLLVAAAVAAAAAVKVGQAGRLRPALIAGAVTLVILVVLTAVFDNLIIAAGLVAYDPALLSGIAVVLAPVEDFSYTLAAVLLLPALWLLLGRRS